MKKTQITIIFLLSNLILFAQEMYISDKLEKIWETPDILKVSESVCYDADRDILFVSCINGNPTGKDGRGYIAKISLDGKIVKEKWVSGLDAPKGMGIYKDKLYVTDIDNITQININSGEVEKHFPVEGAKFLNDIAIDPYGIVYFSDMSTNIIHKLSNGKVEIFLEDPQISSPNGLLYENKDIIIGTKNGVFAVRISDGKIWHLIRDTGGIDGLKPDGKGNYIISDWQGKVQLVNTEKKPEVLLNTTDAGINAADIEFIIDQKLLLIPTFGANCVVAYRVLTE